MTSNSKTDIIIVNRLSQMMPNQKALRGLCSLRLLLMTTAMSRFTGMPCDSRTTIETVSTRLSVTGVTKKPPSFQFNVSLDIYSNSLYQLVIHYF